VAKPRRGSRSRPDHYSDSAKKAGYAARSVYKLSELDKRNHILRPGNRVLDLGAAPGSWSQYAARAVGPGGLVVAVDFDRLEALGPLNNVEAIAGDFTDPQTIKLIADRGPFDVVLSDAAPSTTGNRTVDTARSEGLVESIIDSLPLFLKAGGIFLAKLFQGGGEQVLLATCRSLFSVAKMPKPKASRSESFETYLLGIDYHSDNT
jgi:23S rRNA (uridine2552-2'-O)-methyltransferase